VISSCEISAEPSLRDFSDLANLHVNIRGPRDYFPYFDPQSTYSMTICAAAQGCDFRIPDL